MVLGGWFWGCNIHGVNVGILQGLYVFKFYGFMWSSKSIALL